jgi:large subunit ribosomal protein L35
VAALAVVHNKKCFVMCGLQMPKMKTNSGASKRFRFTASGLVVSTQRGKRHGMTKRSKKFVRNARGTIVLCEAASGIVRKYFPYA